MIAKIRIVVRDPHTKEEIVTCCPAGQHDYEDFLDRFSASEDWETYVELSENGLAGKIIDEFEASQGQLKRYKTLQETWLSILQLRDVICGPCKAEQEQPHDRCYIDLRNVLRCAKEVIEKKRL